MKVALGEKVALCTGSSYGVGKAIAVKLAENGVDVVVNGRTQERGLEIVKQIEALGRVLDGR